MRYKMATYAESEGLKLPAQKAGRPGKERIKQDCAP